MAKCDCCGGKRYLIATRDDGIVAIERCDNCSWFGENDKRTIFDEDAAELARRDGIACAAVYPCFVIFPASFLN